MTVRNLNDILQNHILWLNDNNSGQRAKLRWADLSGADLGDAKLSGADLIGTKLRWANLKYADLRNADISAADLKYADLRNADLSGAKLNNTDLRNVDLRGARLNNTDFSQANGLLSAIKFMETNFEKTKYGYIAYKKFNAIFLPPIKWKIKSGSIIEETVNFDRCTECGSGINVATLDWVKNNYKGDIWKVLIRWEWLCGICVPYNTDGKIRCERIELLKIIKI